MTETTNKFQIPSRLYFRIGDVAELAGVKPYVLRYWESEFPVISPEKSGSGQRVYRRSDVETVLMIKHLLHVERYSIEGAKRRITELRKEGTLKSFKQGMIKSMENVPPSNPPGSTSVESWKSPEKLRAFKDSVFQIRCLARLPITDLFRY